MQMNKHASIVLSVLAACAIAGCGSNAPLPEAPVATEAAVQEIEVSAAPSATDAETVIETPAAPDPTAQPESGNPARQTAFSLVGSPVAALFSELGEPENSSYASSCDGPGEDGELYYDGFTVYTYRENGVETVVDVY